MLLFRNFTALRQTTAMKKGIMFSYFTKCFKEEYGMVPGDVRK